VVRFHANASYIADLMAPRLHIPRNRVEVIPRGRDPARLGERTRERSARVRATLGAAAGGPLVLAVARHEHQKGLDVLLEALPQVLERAPEARLLVAGRDGNQTPLLDATVARLSLGGAVTFLGARDDVADLLCAADLVVIPSRWEGLSNVLIEAMALETPVVTSDLPTLTDAVDRDSALLVPPGRPAQLAEAVIATLEDTGATAARVATAHRHFLRSFTIDRVVDQMVAFYEWALADSGRRRSGAPLV
jgi:glycosyltransferase involved in cell wall biosynthesis